ncbi:hypothetical protein IFR05_016858 [Cadophora sp. M221]|nr:hypothetical protein IFR05_016858 [Cadophora sp. M221]
MVTVTSVVSILIDANWLFNLAVLSLLLDKTARQKWARIELASLHKWGTLIPIITNIACIMAGALTGLFHIHLHGGFSWVPLPNFLKSNQSRNQRKCLPETRREEEIVEHSTVELNSLEADQLQDEALRPCRPIVWIPKDELEIAADEISDTNGAYESELSSKGTDLDEHGKIRYEQRDAVAFDSLFQHDPLISWPELLATETPRGRKIPHLAVGGSDRQRAQELLERPLATAALSDRRQSGQLSPVAGGFLSPQVNAEGRNQSSSTGSSPSEAGIVTENGKRFVPRSVRLDSAIRPEHGVKPGFVPEDDKIPYKNRRVVDGVPQYEVGGERAGSRDVSRRTSLIMSPSEMSPGSYEGENGSGVGNRAFKRARFEPVMPEPRTQAQDQAQPDTETETNTEMEGGMDIDTEMEMKIISTRKTFQATSA